jgi:hypothetical protein
MSTYLRKCIDIAPTAVIRPQSGTAFDYRTLRQQPWWPALRATTSHLRLWADWPAIQPEAGLPPGQGREPGPVSADGAAGLAVLDGQIKSANEDGMHVIVLPYRYPNWANGTLGVVAGGPEDSDLAPWDRVARVRQYLD